MKNSSKDKSLQYWGLLSFWDQGFSSFNNLGFKPQAIESLMAITKQNLPDFYIGDLHKN